LQDEMAQRLAKSRRPNAAAAAGHGGKVTMSLSFDAFQFPADRRLNLPDKGR